MITEKVEQAWKDFTANGYPREFAFPRRVVVSEFSQFASLSWMYFGVHDLYTSIYSYPLIDNNIIDRIFIETDTHEPDGLPRVWEETKSIADVVGECVLLFSARRGFHIHIPIEPITLENPTGAMRNYVKEIEKDTGANHIDWSVVGDIRRITRIPYTPHTKTQRLCIPINRKWSLEKILAESKRPSFSEPIVWEGSGVDLKRYIQPFKEGVQRKEIELPDLTKVRYGDEVNWILEQAKGLGSGRKRVLQFFLIPRLVWAGFEDEKVFAIAEDFIKRTPDTDFDTGQPVRIEDYQAYIARGIQRTRAGKWRPWRLDTFLMKYMDLVKYFEGALGS